MLNAGLSLEHALVTINADGGASSPAAKLMLRKVRSSSNLTIAGPTARVFDPLDLDIIKPVDLGRRLSPALLRLSAWHTARASRAKLVNSRLVLPIAGLILTAFVDPLRALVAGELGVGEYLYGVVLFWGRLALVGWLLWKIPGWSARQQRERGNWLDTLTIRMPIFGPKHVRRQVLQILDSFEMLYTTGVPVDTALSTARPNAANGYIREGFSDTLIRINEGQTLTDAFVQGEYFTEQARHMIRSGDAAGNLTDILQRFSTLESAELA